MSKLVVIAAHAGTEDCIGRHMPYWKMQQGDIVFFSPVDAVVQIKNFPVVCFGEKGHHSPSATERFKAVLRTCLMSNASTFCFMEYDAVAFSQLPSVGQLAGNVFRDTRPDRGFIGTTFIHPPLSFDRTTVERLSTGYQQNDELGHFWDREIGRIVERLNMPVLDFLACGLGYSQNTILPSHHDALRNAVRSGARFIHGIKDEPTLRVIESCF